MLEVSDEFRKNFHVRFPFPREHFRTQFFEAFSNVQRALGLLNMTQDTSGNEKLSEGFPLSKQIVS